MAIEHTLGNKLAVLSELVSHNKYVWHFVAILFTFKE